MEFDKAINLKIDNHEISFRDTKELIAWATEQRNAWTSATEKGAEKDDRYSRQNHLKKITQQFTGLIRQTGAVEESPGDPDKLKRVREKLLLPFSSTGLLPSDSRLGKAIIENVSRDPDTAAILLTFVFPTEIFPDAIEDHLGFSRAVWRAMFEGKDPQSELSRQEERISIAIAREQEGVKEALKAYDKHFQKFQETASIQLNKYDAELSDRKKRTAEMESRIGDLQQAYESKLSYEATSTFWSKKIGECADRAEKLAIAFAFYIAALVITMFVIIVYVPDWIKTITTFNTGLLFLLIVPTVVLIWPARILANRYRTNRALADDAEERVAMIKTFDALQVENRDVGEQRDLLLQAIMRPGPGNQEEPNPHVVMEFLQRVMSGRP